MLRSWQAAPFRGDRGFLRAVGSMEGDMSDWWFRVSKVRVRHVLHEYTHASILVKKETIFIILEVYPLPFLMLPSLKLTTDTGHSLELSCLWWNVQEMDSHGVYLWGLSSLWVHPLGGIWFLRNVHFCEYLVYPISHQWEFPDYSLPGYFEQHLVLTQAFWWSTAIILYLEGRIAPIKMSIPPGRNSHIFRALDLFHGHCIDTVLEFQCPTPSWTYSDTCIVSLAWV